MNGAETVIELPVPVEKALFLLLDRGYEAYVVGGCVRDALSGKEPSDWDITTSARPDEIQRVFHGYRTIPTGLQHGTVTVLLDNCPLEITTYRIDGAYTDGRHPDAVAFTGELAEDLRRRDFTVNAMAYNKRDGLIDLHGGRSDLYKKRIRCVGNPRERFKEDALRLLRALRFSSVLGFSIEGNTANAVHVLPHLLSQISAERIAAELKKLLLGENVLPILQEFTDVWAVILPELSCSQCRQVAVYIAKAPVSLTVRLALLFICHDYPMEAAERALKRLRMENRTVSAVITLLRHRNALLSDDVHLRRLLGQIGHDRLQELLSLRVAVSDTTKEQQQLLKAATHAAAWYHGEICCDLRGLAVNGRDLLTIGYPVGPAVGRELQRLLEAVIKQQCPNRRDELLALARIHKHE